MPTVSSSSSLRKGSLAAIVGIPAAALLLTLIPKEESGRTVKVDIAPNGTATVTHVSGRQYLKAYLDIAGWKTACDGIKLPKGAKKTDFTEQECAVMLEKALTEHAAGAMACTPGLRPNEGMDYQITAAGAHAYQFGVPGYCGSSMAKLFNAGRFAAACDRFPLWNKARVKGVLQPVRSIQQRSNRTRQYCLTGLLPGYTPDNLPSRLKAFQ